jgi:pimeloyl-ACP methyl ester carboxylesterase
MPDPMDDYERTFIGLPSLTAEQGANSHPCQGLYWTPKRNKPKIAFIASHHNADQSEHYISKHLNSRGFGFLGWNTRYRGFEDKFLLERALLDIGVGVRWLRESAGVETVVLLANSGGGSLLAAYLAEAMEPTMSGLLPASAREAYESLPLANLYVSLNAHLGRPEVLTASMDASVVSELDPVPTDPELDPFNPENGPPFSAAFIEKYRAAQRARNQRITDWAKAELRRLNAAGIPDRLFPLYRCWADLRTIDGNIDPSDRPSPMCFRGNPAIANKTMAPVSRASNLTNWLSMSSLETSRCQGRPHLEKLTVPALVVQGTADTGVFPQDARDIHSYLGSKDKTLEFIPGAHFFEDSPKSRTEMASLVCDWVRTRV